MPFNSGDTEAGQITFAAEPEPTSDNDDGREFVKLFTSDQPTERTCPRA